MNKKKYQVNVKRTEWGWVEVEARNKKEAGGIALDEKYLGGMVHWMKEDFEIEDIEEI